MSGNQERLYKNYPSQDWSTSDRIFLFISVNGDVHTTNTEPQVEIVPPTVDGTPSVSGAGTDAQWSVGETVGVTVTFSEAVDVDTSGGTPSIGIGLGGTAARSATYASGTGTTELVFEYTLVSGDGSHGYMAVTPDSLALNGGTIRSAGSGVDALFAHNGALTSGNSGRSTGPEVRFEDVPTGHDGETAFTVALQFSGAPTGLSAKRDAASIFEVTGGSVTDARVTSTGERPVWEVTVAPDGVSDVTVRLPARACGEAHAVCIGGRALAEAVEAAVPGVPLTASFTQAPATHDGSGKFLLHMEFSHEPKRFGYRTVRFALEGSRPFGLGGDAVLTPSLELGVRHDGGDAETGFGADIGAGLALSDPARGISAEVRARGLLTHEAQGMREGGLSGTLAFDPSPETERGLSLSLTQSVGQQGESGVDALLERRTFGDLAAQEGDDLSARRLDARIGYGLGILDDRWTATPELGFGLSDRDRELRLGWRLTESVSTGLAFELGLEGTRRESNDDNPPDYTIGLELRARW